MHMRRLRNVRGQGMLEYILVLTMALAAILFAVTQLKDSLFKGDGTSGYFEKMSTRIGAAGDKFLIVK